jgi:hypothetical protein
LTGKHEMPPGNGCATACARTDRASLRNQAS